MRTKRLRNVQDARTTLIRLRFDFERGQTMTPQHFGLFSATPKNLILSKLLSNRKLLVSFVWMTVYEILNELRDQY